MNNMLPFIPVLFVVLVLLACFWFVVRDNSDDSGLLDFLDQSGFSVQHLSNGLWGITDGAQRLVGKPSKDLREAIRSAVDQVVEDRRG